MLALQNMVSEFTKIKTTEQSNPESHEIAIKKNGESVLLEPTSITTGGKKYRLGNYISSMEARNILIVTRGRSGSSFLGEILAQYPGTFYSYEPLYTVKEKDTLDKVKLLKKVFNCVPGKEYTAYTKWSSILTNNFRLLQSCEGISLNKSECRIRMSSADHVSVDVLCSRMACYIPEVYHSVCSMFPLRLIKTIRLPFEEANAILMDQEIGNTLKIIFLFRDPRGVIQSVRSNVHWCKDEGICNASNYCHRTQDDVTSALRLKKQFPGEIHAFANLINSRIHK